MITSIGRGAKAGLPRRPGWPQVAWKGSPNLLRSSVPETGQASPAQTCAALHDGGCRALVYIFDPSPNFGVLMSKILTATYFYENFVPLCCLNAWQTCCAPRPSIPSFPAVERVTEPVPRVRVIRSHSTTMPCDVSSSFPLSPHVPGLPSRHHCPPSSRPAEPINHTSLCPPSSRT